MVPQIPPAPWHAKTSRESSRVVRALQLPTKLQRTPATKPMMIDGIGPTYPDAGVIATRSQTAPTAIPTADGFPFRTQSVSTQLTCAPAPAGIVAEYTGFGAAPTLFRPKFEKLPMKPL